MSVVSNPYNNSRWERLRLVILERDRYTCHWCGGPARCADHLIEPLNGGDFWSPANLVAACTSCNARRGAHFSHVRYRHNRLNPSRQW
jgi:5-methylcytosine-specific restriction endonuclease McrA